jgi:hypothetical protein
MKSFKKSNLTLTLALFECTATFVVVDIFKPVSIFFYYLSNNKSQNHISDF